ncbi:MAG: hypothetical protein R2800_13915 [Flavipsychrobacter sp.]
MRAVAISLIISGSLLWSACGTPSRFPLTEVSMSPSDDLIVGNWKMEEDTNKHNFYEITQSVEEGKYHVRFFNRGGTNPTFEANIFFSELEAADKSKVKFLNVPYWEKTLGKWGDMGYFFVRILETSAEFSHITTATVNNTEIYNKHTGSEVRAYVLENIDNPEIYSDTVHFYKVNKTTAELRQPYKQ